MDSIIAEESNLEDVLILGPEFTPQLLQESLNFTTRLNSDGDFRFVDQNGIEYRKINFYVGDVRSMLMKVENLEFWEICMEA